MTPSGDGKIEDVRLPISLEQEDVAYRGFRDVVTYVYQDGLSYKSVRREIVSAKHAVAIVAHDRELDKLVMIRQFRIGAHKGTGRGMCVELAAGLIDEGEDPQTAAERELLEETGLQAINMTYMCQFLTTPGLTDEVLHIFYARVDASGLVEEAGHAGESEQTFPFLLSFDEAMAAVDGNSIYNGIVMIGLMWFARQRQHLLDSTS